MNLRKIAGTSVLYIYPRTSSPNGKSIEGWDTIPGARGCTPQSCAFRDHHADLLEAGANAVFGLSVQNTDYQKEMVERLHLPFGVLSDAGLSLKNALNLQPFNAGGMELYKRITLILRNGKVQKAFYPIASPEQNAGDVLLWLKRH